MASPSTVLTLGLGSWGSASLLVTLGYGVGEPEAPEPYGWLEYEAHGRMQFNAESPMHYEAGRRMHYQAREDDQ